MWEYIMGITRKFPHHLIIVLCFSHLSAFTARYDKNIKKTNDRRQLKMVRLKTMRWLCSALSWWEIISIIMEAQLMLKVRELPLNGPIDKEKSGLCLINKKDILEAVTGKNKEEAFIRTSFKKSMGKNLSTTIKEARDVYDGKQDLMRKSTNNDSTNTNDSTANNSSVNSDIINSEWKEFDETEERIIWNG